MLIFDCGGNTESNKQKIRKNKFNYLIANLFNLGTFIY